MSESSLSLGDKLRNWIGEVCFRIYLWSIHKTSWEYFDELMDGYVLEEREIGALHVDMWGKPVALTEEQQ